MKKEKAHHGTEEFTERRTHCWPSASRPDEEIREFIDRRQQAGKEELQKYSEQLREEASAGWNSMNSG